MESPDVMHAFDRELSLTGKSADLPVIIDFIEAACADANVSPDACFDVTLAVEEACTNVIEHAYAGKGGHYRLRFEASSGDVIITVTDHGRSFNPQAVGRPATDIPLDRRPIGGLGLHLMYRLMDDVKFAFDQERNTLVMVKRNVVPNHRTQPGQARQ